LIPHFLILSKIEVYDIKAKIEKLKSGLVRVQETNYNKKETKKMENKSDADKYRDVNAKPAPDKSSAGKSKIVYDDFAKLDLRVGAVKACEKVEKADKLLKLTVDLGTETRTIVSGIALHYQAEEMVGKQVVVVTNLAPRKMKGIESQGMILTAEDKDGKLRLLKPEEVVSPGSAVS
jgi:methionyl-tRNA synthetase